MHQDLTDTVCFCAGRWTLYRCHGCGCGYLDPCPTAETIGQAYATYHTHTEQAGPRPPNGALGRFRRAVRNGYLNARYNFALQPAIAIPAAITAPMLSLRQGRAVRHLRLPRQGARLLDAGCGNGAFVSSAVACGWNAEGVDPDPGALTAGAALGIRITTGSLPQTSYPDAYFAAVTLDHTIEHLHKPVDALREVFRILEPGGFVWIATPNLNSNGHKLFGRHWRGLEPPRHLVLFTAETLRAALADIGYEQIRQLRGPFAGRWWFTASHRIACGEDPLAESGSRLSLLSRLRATAADWRAFMDPSVGEEIIVVAQRPCRN